MKLGRLIGCRKRSCRGYYVGVVLMLWASVVLCAMTLGGAYIAQVTGNTPRRLHLSPLFVTHEAGPDTHHHTLLGDLAFGRDDHYLVCSSSPDEVVVDGVLHVDGKHVMDIRRYGESYAFATHGGEGC